MNWVQGRRSPQGISPRQRSPAFGKSSPAQGNEHPTSKPATPLSPPTPPFSPSKGWGFLGGTGDYWRGRGGGRERSLNPDPLLFQPLRPEFPCHLRASAFLPGMPRVSGLLSAQRCLNGARDGVPAAPKPGAWKPGRRPCKRAGPASRTRCSGAWRCLEARFRSRVWAPAPRLPIRCAGPRTVRRGARTQGAGLPAARGKVELGEVGSGGGEPRGGHRRAVGSARRRRRRGRDPKAPGALSLEQAGERRGGGGGGPGPRGKGGGRRGNSGLGAGREWKWRKGRRLGRGRAMSGEKDGEARGVLAGLKRDRGSASQFPKARVPRPLSPGEGSPGERRRPS